MVWPLQKTVWWFLKKLKIELPYDPTIPLLGMCVYLYLHTHTYINNSKRYMFITELFTIAKTWKQPECPSTDEWIKKMCYIYTMECYSAIKKNKTMPFAAT